MQISTTMSLIDSILANSQRYLSFPHPVLMRNCGCGGRKFVTKREEMTVIACCRGGGDDEDQTAHDIPTMLDEDVDYRNSPAWLYFLDPNADF